MTLFEGVIYLSWGLLFAGPYLSVKAANQPYFKVWALAVVVGYAIVIGVPFAFPSMMVCSDASGCMGVGLAWVGSAGIGLIANLIALFYAATRPIRYGE